MPLTVFLCPRAASSDVSSHSRPTFTWGINVVHSASSGSSGSGSSGAAAAACDAPSDGPQASQGSLSDAMPSMYRAAPSICTLVYPCLLTADETPTALLVPLLLGLPPAQVSPALAGDAASLCAVVKAMPERVRVDLLVGILAIDGSDASHDAAVVAGLNTLLNVGCTAAAPPGASASASASQPGDTHVLYYPDFFPRVKELIDQNTKVSKVELPSACIDRCVNYAFNPALLCLF